MSEWRTIDSAPRDGTRVLVYGKPEPLRMDGETLVEWNITGVHAAYWDACDGAFCLDGGSWLGPFIEPTHWQPLPEPPPAYP